MASWQNSMRTVARDAGCQNLVLLKCTSTYPATPENTNIRTIPHLRDLFGWVGLSDHHGLWRSRCGSCVRVLCDRKHFTLARADGSVDAAFCAGARRAADVSDGERTCVAALGKVAYGASSAEKQSLVFRRRSMSLLTSVRDNLTRDNVRAIRPRLGLAPR